MSRSRDRGPGLAGNPNRLNKVAARINYAIGSVAVGAVGLVIGAPSPGSAVIYGAVGTGLGLVFAGAAGPSETATQSTADFLHNTSNKIGSAITERRAGMQRMGNKLRAIGRQVLRSSPSQRPVKHFDDAINVSSSSQSEGFERSNPSSEDVDAAIIRRGEAEMSDRGLRAAKLGEYLEGAVSPSEIMKLWGAEERSMVIVDEAGRVQRIDPNDPTSEPIIAESEEDAQGKFANLLIATEQADIQAKAPKVTMEVPRYDGLGDEKLLAEDGEMFGQNDRGSAPHAGASFEDELKDFSDELSRISGIDEGGNLVIEETNPK